MRLIDADLLTKWLGINLECKNCQYYHVDRCIRYDTSFTDVCEAIYDAPTVLQWTPIAEKLPKPEKSVLLCDIDGDIYLGHLTRYGEYYPDLGDDRIKNVIAWMPRPRPYQEVDE